VDDESASKRPRLDFVLTAEDEFLAEHGEGPSKVSGKSSCAIRPSTACCVPGSLHDWSCHPQTP
jgi:hypothetical protein